MRLLKVTEAYTSFVRIHATYVNLNLCKLKERQLDVIKRTNPKNFSTWEI